MSMMDTDIDMRVFEDLVFDPSLTCEHSDHTRRPDEHSDEDGVWQVIAHLRPCCGAKGGAHGETLLCDKFVQQARDGGLKCGGCGSVFEFWQRYTILEKIK